MLLLACLWCDKKISVDKDRFFGRFRVEYTMCKRCKTKWEEDWNEIVLDRKEASDGN